MAMPDEVHQLLRGVAGGGQRAVEEGEDLFVGLAEDERVVGVGGHPLQAVDDDLDGGKDVRVAVLALHAVLAPLRHQSLEVVGDHPGGRAVGDLRGMPALFLAVGRLVERLHLFLQVVAFSQLTGKLDRIEIDVGDRGEEPLDAELVGDLVAASMPAPFRRRWRAP